MDYDNFSVKIRRGSDSKYEIEVVDSRNEEAEGVFESPFNTEELENISLRIGGNIRVRGKSSSNVKVMEGHGDRLAKALLANDVRDLFTRSVERAADKRLGLRVVLSLSKAPELLDLPWEFMFLDDESAFVGLAHDMSLIRSLERPYHKDPAPILDQVRILVMVSSPDGYPQLDLVGERRRIQDAMEPLIESGAVAIHWLKTATLAELNDELSRQEFHIFHYVGHAGFDTTLGEGELVLEGRGGGYEVVSGTDMGNILCDHPSLRLAVLNACEGARASADDPFTGVATSLIKRGLPAVVAMQFEITDEAALVFAQSFYSALVLDGREADVAVHAARKAMYAHDRNGLEWGTPVLFLSNPTVELFDVTMRPNLGPSEPTTDRPRESAASVGEAERAVDTAPTPSPPPVPPRPEAAPPPPPVPPRPEAAPPPPLQPPPSTSSPKATTPPPPPPPGAPASRAETATTPTPYRPPPPPQSAWDVSRPSPSEPQIHLEEVLTLPHGAPIAAAAMSLDGRWVVTAGGDRTIRVWSSRDGAYATGWIMEDEPTDVSLNRDGSLAAVACGAGCWVYRVADRRQVALLAPGRKPTARVRAVEFSPDGRLLAAANDTGQVEAWVPGKWQSAGHGSAPKGHGSIVRVRFHAAGQRMAVAGSVAGPWFWDLTTGSTYMCRAAEGTASAADLAFSSDGGRLAVATANGVAVIDLQIDHLEPAVGLSTPARTVDLSPDGRWLIAGTTDGRFLVWDHSGRLRLQGATHGVVSTLRFSANGRGLLAAGSDGTARLWQASVA